MKPDKSKVKYIVSAILVLTIITLFFVTIRIRHNLNSQNVNTLIYGAGGDNNKLTGVSYSDTETKLINNRNIFVDYDTTTSFKYPANFTIDRLVPSKDVLRELPIASSSITNLWEIIYSGAPATLKAYLIKINNVKDFKLFHKDQEIFYDPTSIAWIEEYRSSKDSHKIVSYSGKLIKVINKDGTYAYKFDLNYPFYNLKKFHNPIAVKINNCKVTELLNKHVVAIGRFVKPQPNDINSYILDIRALVYAGKDVTYCNSTTDTKSNIKVFPLAGRSFTKFGIIKSNIKHIIYLYKLYDNRLMVLDKVNNENPDAIGDYLIRTIATTWHTGSFKEQLNFFDERYNPIAKFQYPSSFILKTGPARGSKEINQMLASDNINAKPSDVIKSWILQKGNYQAHIYYVNNIRRIQFNGQPDNVRYIPRFNGWFHFNGKYATSGLNRIKHYGNQANIYFFENGNLKHLDYFMFEQRGTALLNGIIVALPKYILETSPRHVIKYYPENKELANAIYYSIVPQQLNGLKPFSFNTSHMKVEFKYPVYIQFLKYTNDTFRKQLYPFINLNKMHIKVAWNLNRKSSLNGYILWAYGFKNLEINGTNSKIKFDNSLNKWVKIYSNNKKEVIYPMRNWLYITDIQRETGQKFYVMWSHLQDEGIIMLIPEEWEYTHKIINKYFKLWMIGNAPKKLQSSNNQLNICQQGTQTLDNSYKIAVQKNYEIKKDDQPELIRIYTKGNTCKDDGPIILKLYSKINQCYKEVLSKKFDDSFNMINPNDIKYFTSGLGQNNPALLIPLKANHCGSGAELQSVVLAYNTITKKYFIINLPRITTEDYEIYPSNNLLHTIVLKAIVGEHETHYGPHHYKIILYTINDKNGKLIYMPTYLGTTKQKYSINEMSTFQVLINDLQSGLNTNIEKLKSISKKYTENFTLSFDELNPRGKFKINLTFTMPQNNYKITKGGALDSFYFKISDKSNNWQIKFLKTTTEPANEYKPYTILDPKLVKYIGNIRIGLSNNMTKIYRISYQNPGNIFYVNDYMETGTCKIWNFEEKAPCAPLSIMLDTTQYIHVNVTCNHKTNSQQELDNCLQGADELVKSMHIY